MLFRREPGRTQITAPGSGKHPWRQNRNCQGFCTKHFKRWTPRLSHIGCGMKNKWQRVPNQYTVTEYHIVWCAAQWKQTLRFEFAEFHTSLDTETKRLQSKRLGTIHKAEPFTEEKEELLWKNKILGPESLHAQHHNLHDLLWRRAHNQCATSTKWMESSCINMYVQFVHARTMS